jgi:hypothetical protein
LQGDVAEVCGTRGSGDWLSPRRAPSAAISRAGAGQTPIQRASDTSCRVLVVVPAEEADPSGRGLSLESRFGVSRNEASCAHDPFTSPPGFRSRSSGPSEPAFAKLAAVGPRLRRASGRGPLRASFREEERRRLHPRCLPSWDHHPLGEGLRAALPARAHRLARRLGGFPQVVPNLWICACAFSSPAVLALPDGVRRTPRLGRPPTSFS